MKINIIYTFLILAFISGISISCQKETNLTVSGKELVVTASIAPAGTPATTQTPGTKVSYTEDGEHDLKPSWQIGDIIIGFDAAATPNTYGYHVVAVGNDGKADLSRITAGEFKGTATKEPSEGTTLYMFYAPGMRPSDIDLDSKTLAVSIAYQDLHVVPALMMAKGTVTDNHLLLHFTNQTAIFALKNPTMAHAGTEYTKITLSGQGLCTELVFSLDGSDNLQTSYRKSGTVIKAVNFTSDHATKKGPGIIYIVACPLATPSVLTFKANTGENFRTASPMSIMRNNYYYSSPTFGQDETIEFESLVKNDEML